MTITEIEVDDKDSNVVITALDIVQAQKSNKSVKELINDLVKDTDASEQMTFATANGKDWYQDIYDAKCGLLIDSLNRLRHKYRICDFALKAVVRASSKHLVDRIINVRKKGDNTQE